MIKHLTVKLSYFKPHGKWYTDAEMDFTYDSDEPPPLFKVWDTVILLRDLRMLPGLVKGHSQYLILVCVPDHPHGHPTIIVPEAMKSEHA
jgi:hypothetical protein